MTQHNAHAEKKPGSYPISIERNGITATLGVSKFGKLHSYKGHEFNTYETSQATFETDCKWLGLDFVTSVLNKRIRKDMGEIFVNAVENEDGTPREKFAMEQYLKDLADFTAGEAKLADLQEDYEDLVAQQQELITKPEASEMTNEGQFTEAAQAILDQIRGLAPKINSIRASIKAIKDKYADRAAKREAAKAAKLAAGGKVEATA